MGRYLRVCVPAAYERERERDKSAARTYWRLSRHSTPNYPSVKRTLLDLGDTGPSRAQDVGRAHAGVSVHGIRRGIVAASVQEAVGGGFLKGWCVIMRHGPPASHATPSVCARGLHMPPPAKAWVSSRSGERCQEKEGDVGQNVQGLQGAARRRTRPVRRLPATRAAS